MNKYQIRIELLSDLCVSDGSIYNSSIDTDVCKDEYGFPYIPAKRIRGCLRECALELDDWGESIDPDTLFGKEGAAANQSSVRIGNAELENIKSLHEQAIRYHGSLIMHPQNILNHYSYLKTQTSVDYETGVADDASLRTMRVVRKGLVFIADVKLNSDDLYPKLNDCCSILHRIGIARTRGLGEVRVTLEKTEVENNKNQHAMLTPGATRLDYSIHLDEPMICKSLNGGEAHTLDYIEGSKILGIVADYLNRNNRSYREFIDAGNLHCSCAFIGDAQKRRYTEVPGFIYSIKDNKTRYINNLTSGRLNNSQMPQQMHHTYVILNDAGQLLKKDVSIEESYHHRRPEDKGIGRASSEADNNAAFYQMEAISSGQAFIGSITGSPEQIRDCYAALTESDSMYLGYSRTSEYGRVSITVDGTTSDDSGEVVNIAEQTDFAVVLHAPAIVYNQNAMASTNPKDLVDEVGAELIKACELQGMPLPSICSSVENGRAGVYFMRYTDIGGFNTTWNMPKPVIPAFDKGTAIILHTDKAINAPSIIFLGERRREGFGEAEIIPITDRIAFIGEIKDSDDETTESESSELRIDFKDTFAWDLCRELYLEFVRSKAVENVQNIRINPSQKATVSNLMLICRDCRTLDEVCTQAAARWGDKKSGKKISKNATANGILNEVHRACSGQENGPDESSTAGLVSEFSSAYNIHNFKDVQAEQTKMEYLRAFLVQLKYMLRSAGGVD